MKKFISFALAASMALSMVPATAFAASDLTTSHSNIRVTSNFEFFPKELQGGTTAAQPGDVRDIPYVELKATTNFKNERQTFALSLENAEWLENETEKDANGDIEEKLYIELDKFIKADAESGVQFKPDKAPAESGSDTTTPSPSGSTADLGALEKAYKDKALALVAAGEAYLSAIDTDTAVSNAMAAVVTATSAAATAANSLALAQSAADKAQADFDEVSKYTQAEIDALAAAYDQALADRNSSDAYVWWIDSTANPSATSEPDDPTDESKSTLNANGSEVAGGKFAGVSANSGKSITFTYYNATITASGATFANIDEVKTAFEALSPAPELNNTGVSALDYHTDWVAAQEAVTKLQEAVDKAKADAQKAGIECTTFGANKDKVTQAIADAQTALDEANADLSAAQKAKDDADKDLADKQKALDTALASSADKKAAFDKALEERNAAGLAVLNAGGKQEEQILAQMDIDVTLASGDSATPVYNATPASTTNKHFSDIGVAQLTIDDLQAAKAAGVLGTYETTVGDNKLEVKITKKSDSTIIVETSGYTFQKDDVLSIPLFVRTTGGVASISIDSMDSEFTSQGKTFAKTGAGDTELTIEKVQNFYDDDEIKNIYIEELVAGTLEPGKDITLRVNGDFLLKHSDKFKITMVTGNGLPTDLTSYVYYKEDKVNKSFTNKAEADEIFIHIPESTEAKAAVTKSSRAVQYRIEGLKIVEDGADFGDEASLTISGAGTTKQTVAIGKYEDYGVKMTAEDKDLPVIYAGTRANSKFDNQTLKVTIEETVANSFIDNRKMELTLPEGVEFVNDNGELATTLSDIDEVVEDFKVYNFAGSESQVKDAFEVKGDGTKITINGKDLPDASGTNKDRKRKIEFSVHVSAEADFTGDVVMKLSGPAIADREVTATIATVKAPIEVKADVNELRIDYRQTDVSDITLVEPEAGLWAKDDRIYIVGERMSFESGAKAEVVNGDMKLDKLSGDYVKKDGDTIYVQVSSRSSKTPAEIKLSGLSLYMDRSLAAGDYKLKVHGDTDNEFFMNNYHEKGDDYANSFETDDVTVMDDFVKIVTAGRDKDDATFTTTIVVPVGGDTITAGTKQIKLSEMEGGACPPAYINNDGYTMLPVRAVTEALNSVASVRWDDATKTCTIGFGQRVFSMTVGSKVLNLNGVATALNAAPEIRDGRVFLPLRDLGYALGLSESQVSWDASTQTAKLN